MSILNIMFCMFQEMYKEIKFPHKGTALMFCVVLDLGGICLRGLLSLPASQLLNGVANLM